jgi:hypothetical protein
MTEPTSPTAPPRDDILTLVAIASLAYISASMAHEAGGHGIVCHAAGGRATIFSIFMQCSVASRAMIAAGPLTEFAVGVVLFFALRFLRPSSLPLRCWLWLAMAFCLLRPAGYLILSGLMNFGDAAAVLAGVQPAWRWRSALVVTGAALYYLGMRAVAWGLSTLLGPGDPQRLRQFTTIPYLTAGVVACLAALCTPVQKMDFLVLAAAATFGGGWGLLSARGLVEAAPSAQSVSAPPLARSLGWIVAGLVATVVFMFVISRGVSF